MKLAMLTPSDTLNQVLKPGVLHMSAVLEDVIPPSAGERKLTVWIQPFRRRTWQAAGDFSHRRTEAAANDYTFRLLARWPHNHILAGF